MLLGLVTWVVFLGAYFLFAGQVSATEIVAGVPSSAAVGCFAVVLHRTQSRRFRLQGPWWRILGLPLAAVFPDAARVGRVLLRAVRRRPFGAVGVVAPQAFRPGGDDPAAASRRGLVTLGCSLAPNGYVLEIQQAAKTLLLHRLAPVPPNPDTDWPL